MTKHTLDRSGLRTWIEVDTHALKHNIASLRSAIPSSVKMMAVTKSNAYGHGLVEFSQHAEACGVDWIGVDSITEAIALREGGIKAPVFVLGYTLPEMLPRAAEHSISLSVSTFETLSAIAGTSFSEKLRIHIKVDTGMHRQGFQVHEIDRVLTALSELGDNVIVEGLFTHFGAAKNPSFQQRVFAQIMQFEQWVKAFSGAGIHPLKHVAASGGAIAFPNSHFDMVRIGIAMYGVYPSKEVSAFSHHTLNLKPVLSWRTVIGETKRVAKGERVGYDFTEELTRDSVLAVCPIGYWHGYPRALSSIGVVLVRGAQARVVGRVSMDMIVIDITDIPEVSVGDVVTLIGADGDEYIGAETLADKIDMSPYEFITRLNPLIKRIYR